MEETLPSSQPQLAFIKLFTYLQQIRVILFCFLFLALALDAVGCLFDGIPHR